MANWQNVSIDLDLIPSGEFKGIVIDSYGNTVFVNLPNQQIVEFSDTKYIDSPLISSNYKIYELISNNDEYKVYSDITDTVETFIKLTNENVKTLMIKSNRKLSGYIQFG